jgi:uncharacterized protein (DUF58 family)
MPVPADTTPVRRLVLRWVADRHTRHHGPLTLQRRKIYILPTRYGLLFGAMAVVLLLSAINYGNSMAFAVAFLLMGIGLMDMYHTHQNLLGLMLEPLQAKAIFAGMTANFPLRLHNPSRRPRMSILLESPDGNVTAVDVPGQAQIVAELAVNSKQRGLLSAPRFAVSTRHPLGLFRAWTWMQLEMDCLVYPQPLAKASLPANSLGTEGEQRPTSIAGQDDFNGLREYRQGDSYRHIAWRHVARRDGDPITKIYTHPTSAQLWLDYDELPELTCEERLSHLCRLVLDCESRSIRYGLRVPEQDIAPDLGIQHKESCLRTLALYGLEGTHSHVT